ncbi:PEP-CTERM sorting domain-containing protein [Pseudoduganella sp. FT55W]|uniref:PEP-CTERM sorting domain-containing protein n=1 Tax=Duganella rivi TaxID=2666083 RepID=A0A7X4GN41_9BURK|nr:PEP-CTERM sorting domain-containing protein [Duganella rivi]MYM65971.1 PEP-CTERM sorting domain-containing protein [Duganella rivi]
MKRLAMHTLVAGCLAAAVGQASATAASSAITSNLNITLFDLNPTDSTTPWLKFAPSQVATVHNDAVGAGDALESYSSDDYAPGPKRDGMLTAGLTTDWSSTTGSVATAANAAGFTAMSSQGIANSGLDGSGSYRNFIANSNGGQNFFTLSPMTKITFSMTADLKAFTSMGYNLDADMGEFAIARSFLNISGTVNGVDQFDSQEQGLWVYYNVNDDNTVSGVSESWSGTLEVSFYNYGSTATDVRLHAFAGTEGRSAIWDGVTPVPEPSTYGMMLGGLGLLGAAARRHRSKAV